MPSPRMALPYAWPELRRACLRVAQTVKRIPLTGHTVNICDMRPYLVESGWQIGVHAHSFYETHLFLQGSGSYPLDGADREIGTGSVVLHAPYTPHAWTATSENLRLVCWFRVEPRLVVPPLADWPVWPELGEEVRRLFEDALVMQPGWRDRVLFRTGLILSRVLTSAEWHEPAPAAEAPRYTLITMVEHFLRDNIAHALLMVDVAAHVGMSVSSVAHQFSEATGETVMQRLMHLRLMHAAQLLTENDEPLAVIGARVGIPDPSYFCRRFRRRFGITPDAYRKRNSQNPASHGDSG